MGFKEQTNKQNPKYSNKTGLTARRMALGGALTTVARGTQAGAVPALR